MMSEYDSQCALMEMAALWQEKVPELREIFHVPNGGARDAITGARLKRAGVKRGVPDLFLLVPRSPYHGLVIELKTEIGLLSVEQKWWIDRLRARGLRVEVCKGHMAAWHVLEDYLNTNMPLQMR
jgi:hypothetical protein